MDAKASTNTVHVEIRSENTDWGIELVARGVPDAEVAIVLKRMVEAMEGMARREEVRISDLVRSGEHRGEGK